MQNKNDLVIKAIGKNESLGGLENNYISKIKIHHLVNPLSRTATILKKKKVEGTIA
jgi:hypothetical protein